MVILNIKDSLGNDLSNGDKIKIFEVQIEECIDKITYAWDVFTLDIENDLIHKGYFQFKSFTYTRDNLCELHSISWKVGEKEFKETIMNPINKFLGTNFNIEQELIDYINGYYLESKNIEIYDNNIFPFKKYDKEYFKCYFTDAEPRGLGKGEGYFTQYVTMTKDISDMLIYRFSWETGNYYTERHNLGYIFKRNGETLELLKTIKL